MSIRTFALFDKKMKNWTWKSRVGKNLQSIGKMEEALSGKEIVDTGQRSRIGLGVVTIRMYKVWTTSWGWWPSGLIEENLKVLGNEARKENLLGPRVEIEVGKLTGPWKWHKARPAKDCPLSDRDKVSPTIQPLTHMHTCVYLRIFKVVYPPFSAKNV